MVKLLVVVLLLSLLIYAATAWDAEGFFNFKSCSPNRCSKHGPEVRFPLRLSLQSPSCGTPLLELSCSGQDIILYHQVLGSCKVTEISYKNASMTVIPLVDSTPHCPLQKLILANLSTDAYKPQTLGAASLPDCTVVCKGIHSPSTYKETEDGVIGVSSYVITIAAPSVAIIVVLLLIVATALYLFLKPQYDEEVHLKVEMFLKTYGTSKPKRYTFSEVRKIARRFKHKLGQGGFGSVYKGDLPNGVPVAVKMLENSIGDGQEFINEVATIGTIHHANVLRLLGFCSEGTRRALIYEFMPNDSLDKYIFSQGSDVSRDFLVPAKMVDIALGIARGMEYLHQGCNQRILHFDIKPHNILLDYRFNPKISDFGLAKLCARDQSIVTLTAARGTKGYIAPELYSRNFGAISYKSDVYSFGMLVIEMVSGRRNLDPNIETQDEVYFPEWIYENLFTGQHLTIGMEMTQDEKDRVRQLAIVALWCVQWNPKNRPSTTQVVNMLTGRLQDLQMPPKPFVSSTSNSMQ
uniref:non-specific serine/threonine protein kinase n=1 Tax=Oryza brachyantha TaxID=4533 RepID=J3KVV4_ORYBR